MYGLPARPRTVQEQAADEAFVDRVAKDFGGREQASKAWVDQGFRFYKQDDLATAMRRFNQAWLLNPTNPEVFWGFASVLHDRGRACDARKMIERALELKLSKPDALADAGRIYALCSLDPSLDDKTKMEYVRRAYNLYVDASVAAPNSGYVYSSWATAYYWTGNYREAWAMVKKARALGSPPSERFIKLLREKMPEPRD